jgi:hypothetical protein
LGSWTESIEQASAAYTVLLNATLKETPEEATEHFTYGMSCLHKSVKGLPGTKRITNLRVDDLDWNTETSKILEKVGLGNKEQKEIHLRLMQMEQEFTKLQSVKMENALLVKERQELLQRIQELEAKASTKIRVG